MSKPDLKAVDSLPVPMSDPFDLASLRLSQDFEESVGVKKLIRTIPTRKPNAQDFVRVHPSEDYRLLARCVELKEDRELYLVRPEIAHELVGETVVKTLFTAINRQGVLFVWPVSIPAADAKQLEWWRSMREAAELAMTSWVRVKANMNLGAYEIFEAGSLMAEPAWPEISFQEILRIAFREGRIIAQTDHPVIKRLRGEA
jgi:hypothetical protein